MRRFFLALVACLVVLAGASPAGAMRRSGNAQFNDDVRQAYQFTCSGDGWESHNLTEFLAVLQAEADCHGTYWMLNGFMLVDTYGTTAPNGGDTLNEWLIGGTVKARFDRCENYGGTPSEFLGIVVCIGVDF